MLKFGEEDKTTSEIVREFFTAPFREEEKGLSKFISPSGLGCPVAVSFKLSGTPLSPSLTTFFREAVPNYGTHRHEEIQNHFIKSGWWVSPEEYIKEHPELGLSVLERNNNEVKLEHKELKLHFYLDGLLKINDKHYILEIKTESESEWSKRKAYNPKHKLQILSYSAVLQIPDVFMIYEARGKFEQKYFEIFFTQEERKEHLEYIKNIIANAETPWLLKRNSGDCVYCKYKVNCREVILKQQERS